MVASKVAMIEWYTVTEEHFLEGTNLLGIGPLFHAKFIEGIMEKGRYNKNHQMQVDNRSFDEC